MGLGDVHDQYPVDVIRTPAFGEQGNDQHLVRAEARCCR